MQEKRFEVVLVAKHYNDSKRQERKMVPKDLFVMRVTYLYIELIRKSILSCGNYFTALYSKDLRLCDSFKLG